jgi:hypothetical protein
MSLTSPFGRCRTWPTRSSEGALRKGTRSLRFWSRVQGEWRSGGRPAKGRKSPSKKADQCGSPAACRKLVLSHGLVRRSTHYFLAQTRSAEPLQIALRTSRLALPLRLRQRRGPRPCEPRRTSKTVFPKRSCFQAVLEIQGRFLPDGMQPPGQRRAHRSPQPPPPPP